MKDNFRRLLQRLIDYDDLNPAHFEMSGRQVLEQTIGDPLLREMLLCPLMWYGNAAEHDMPFGQFCIMFRSIFLEGFARPLVGFETFEAGETVATDGEHALRAPERCTVLMPARVPTVGREGFYLARAIA